MSARWLVALCGVAGCATVPAPYRFQSELISGVTANVELEHHRDPTGDREGAPVRIAARETRRADRPVARRAATAPITREDVVVAAADPFPREEPPATTPAPTARAGQLVLSSLPSPHRADGAVEVALAARPTDAELRALLGTRTTDDPIAFAVDAAARLAGVRRPDPMPADGAALAAWAGERAHAATVDPADARPGDLLVFDRAIGGQPASLWAVVAARDAHGVIEMVYVGAGIVRRGFVDPAQPHVARDPHGTVHNTFLRHGKDWPPKGTRYLTGELLAGAFRLR